MNGNVEALVYVNMFYNRIYETIADSFTPFI